MQQPIDIPPTQRTDLQYPTSDEAYLSTSPDLLASAPPLPNTPSSNRPRRTSSRPNSSATPPQNRQPEHQWTLFGQLMENEGHLGVSPASNSNRSLRESEINSFMRRGSSPSDSSHFFEPTHKPLEQRVFQEASPLRGDLAAQQIRSSEHEYDSDDYSSSHSVSRSPSSSRTSSLSCPLFRRPSISLVWRNVFKCAIAYFIGSLFTFTPYLSRLLADVTSGSSPIPSPSGHMVATM